VPRRWPQPLQEKRKPCRAKRVGLILERGNIDFDCSGSGSWSNVAARPGGGRWRDKERIKGTTMNQPASAYFLESGATRPVDTLSVLVQNEPGVSRGL